jgi:N6-adenosine-specific RNA methylase IME4
MRFEPYRVIVVDPPWSFGDRLAMSAVRRGSVDHYPTMLTAEIAAIPVGDWCAPDAVLALWTPSALLADGLVVMAAWGFAHKQVYTWLKGARNPRPPRPPRFADLGEAWREILHESGVDDYDCARADAAYARGERLGPYPGGHLDEVNRLLDLAGDDRCSGGREAFDRLMGRSRFWSDALAAIPALRTIPGLERLRLPEAVEAELHDFDREDHAAFEVKLQMGMGHHFRGCTEHALIGVRGRPKPDSRSQLNAHCSPALRHSAKPEELQDKLEAMYAGPRLELFARRARDGWDCVGNEAPGYEDVDLRTWSPSGSRACRLCGRRGDLERFDLVDGPAHGACVSEAESVLSMLSREDREIWERRLKIDAQQIVGGG